MIWTPTVYCNHKMIVAFDVFLETEWSGCITSRLIELIGKSVDALLFLSYARESSFLRLQPLCDCCHGNVLRRGACGSKDHDKEEENRKVLERWRQDQSNSVISCPSLLQSAEDVLLLHFTSHKGNNDRRHTCTQHSTNQKYTHTRTRKHVRTRTHARIHTITHAHTYKLRPI